MTSFPGQHGQAGTGEVKPIWILMKQQVMGWQWHQLDHYANHLYIAADR